MSVRWNDLKRLLGLFTKAGSRDGLFRRRQLFFSSNVFTI